MSSTASNLRLGILLACLGLASTTLAGCLTGTRLTISARNFTDQNINLALEIRRVGGDLVYNQTFSFPPTEKGQILKLDSVKLKNGDYDFIAQSGNFSHREQRTVWGDDLQGWGIHVHPQEISFGYSVV